VGSQVSTEELAEAVRQVLQPTGLELMEVDVAFGRGGGRLRLVVDRPGGVTLDECGRASRLVSAWLDVADPFPGPYTLEVTSPGAERLLRDDRELEAAIGHRIRLEMEGAEASGRLILEARLVAISPTTLDLEVPPGRRRAGEHHRVDRAVVIAARRLVDL